MTKFRVETASRRKTSSLGDEAHAKKLKNLRTAKKKTIFGSHTKSPVSFGAKGQNGLEPAICRTLWREQYLPRGLKPQTEFAGLFGAIFFGPFGAKAYSSWFAIYGASKKGSGGFGAKCCFGDFCPNCLFQTVHAFLACEKESTSFCFRQNTTQLAFGR